jgi:5-methylcytosine-specific restriction endonuclease McrA
VRRFALPLVAALSLAWMPPERTKHSGCETHGLLPDGQCTPGAVETTSLAVVCGSSAERRRHVTEGMRRRVFAEYGLGTRHPEGAYEVDHLIPLELGGSNEIANLWPEAAPGFHEKDKVEEKLHARVCTRRMTLEDAQRAIATDWRALR